MRRSRKKEKKEGREVGGEEEKTLQYGNCTFPSEVLFVELSIMI